MIRGESTHRRRYFLLLQALRIEPLFMLPVVETNTIRTFAVLWFRLRLASLRLSMFWFFVFSGFLVSLRWEDGSQRERRDERQQCSECTAATRGIVWRGII